MGTPGWSSLASSFRGLQTCVVPSMICRSPSSELGWEGLISLCPRTEKHRELKDVPLCY